MNIDDEIPTIHETVIEEVSDLCRLCANNDNQLIPIFQGEGLELEISAKIKKYLPIRVTQFDKLPSQICYQCASSLISWHNLYESCRLADERLQSLVNNDDGDSNRNYCLLSPKCEEKLKLEITELSSTQTAIEKTYDVAISNRTDVNIHDERRPDQNARRKRRITSADKTNPSVVPVRQTRSYTRLQREEALRPLLATATTSDRSVSEAVALEPTNTIIDAGDVKDTSNIRSVEKLPSRSCKTKTSIAPVQNQIVKTESDNHGLNILQFTPIQPGTKVLKFEPTPLFLAPGGMLIPVKLIPGQQPSHLSEYEVQSLVTCPVCLLKFKSDNILKKHMDTVHNITKASIDHNFCTCYHCGYRCKMKASMRRHIVKVHMDQKVDYKGLILQFILQNSLGQLICGACLGVFKNKKTLKKHIIGQHLLKKKTDPSWRNVFCCDVCGEGFQKAQRMLAHREVMHPDLEEMSWTNFRSSYGKVKFCNGCNKYFREGKHFNDHSCDPDVNEEVICKIKDVLNACARYKCNNCSLCFLWKVMYRQHHENSHPSETLDWENLTTTLVPRHCTECFMTFNNETLLNEHECIDYEKEITPKTYHCELCKTTYPRKSSYFRHVKLKHLAEFQDEKSVPKANAVINCPYCEMTAKSKPKIITHVEEVHGVQIDSPFVCVACNKIFKRKSTLETHNTTHHPKEESLEEVQTVLKEAEILLNGEQAWHCSICNRNMIFKDKFMAHYRLHKIERKFTCEACGKQMRTQHQLNTHFKYTHLDIRNYECDFCEKTFHSKQACVDHRRIHTGERPFACEVCGKTFIAMNALLTHKKFHDDFYAHQCHLCPKKFKIKTSLINHIRTHTGERPFKCNMCSKTFNNSSRFSYHKKVTHSDDRPFTCRECGSCFKANKFLLRHMQLHSSRSHIQFKRRNNPSYFTSPVKLNINKENKHTMKEKNKETDHIIALDEHHEIVNVTDAETIATIQTSIEVISN